MGVRVPILTYHKIAPIDPKTIFPGTFVPPKVFRQHLNYLSRKQFRSVRVEELFSDSMPSKPICLTFDDGFQDFSDNAFPLLQEFGLSGTVYLVAQKLGLHNDWDVLIGDSPAPLMNVQTIRELIQKGVEFGSHTLDHCHLDQIERETQRKQLNESKSILERELEISINSICYPYGGFNSETIEEAVAAGYKYGLSTQKGLNDSSTPKFELNRIAIRHDTSLPILVYKLWRAFTLGK